MDWICVGIPFVRRSGKSRDLTGQTRPDYQVCGEQARVRRVWREMNSLVTPGRPAVASPPIPLAPGWRGTMGAVDKLLFETLGVWREYPTQFVVTLVLGGLLGYLLSRVRYGEW
jgi:hypothetical protein